MAQGKVLAICQMGGEFVRHTDGSMSYSGGDAHAIDIDCEMTLDDLKAEISSMFNCDAGSCLIKYFLPNNKKTLISVSNDKDLKRMIDFHAGSDTTDLYVLKKVDNRLIQGMTSDPSLLMDATPTSTSLVCADGAKRQKISADWNDMITGIGQVFDSPKAFRDMLHKYAIANKFTYRFIKNDTSRVTAECTAEDCPWRIHASRSPSKKEFTIKKITDTHTCREETVKSHRLATQRWVASVIKEKLRDTPNYRPRDIANDLQQEYGLNLNYTQAWRGKFIAAKELNNPHEEARNQLPWFCERIIETNPGSVATVTTSEEAGFHLFVAFHASLSGYEHGCRPLIFLDGMFLKANRQWKLLTATSVDGEGNIFPVSFGVVDAETPKNWRWFLQQLKSTLCTAQGTTFISNGQNGLLEEIPLVFEESYHGYCMHYLTEEFRARLDDAWNEDVKESLVDLFKASFCACTEDEFNHCMKGIKKQSEQLAKWLLDMKPELWSDAYFKGLRLGQYSSNAAESFVEWLTARYELSLVQMIDMIRCKIMEMMYMRRKSSEIWSNTLVPLVEQKLQSELIKSRDLTLIRSSGDIFEVSDGTINSVNLGTWECTCRRWQVNGLPCMHVLAVLERTDRCVYDYCSKYFTTDVYRAAYASSINPIPDIGSPGGADASLSTIICPTRTRRLVGRPKEKPADPRIAIKRAVRCSRCKGFGHNKATCKTPM